MPLLLNKSPAKYRNWRLFSQRKYFLVFSFNLFFFFFLVEEEVILSREKGLDANLVLIGWVLSSCFYLVNEA